MIRSNQASGLSSVTNKAAPGLKNGMDYVKLGSSDLQVSKGKWLSHIEHGVSYCALTCQGKYYFLTRDALVRCTILNSMHGKWSSLWCRVLYMFNFI